MDTVHGREGVRLRVVGSGDANGNKRDPEQAMRTIRVTSGHQPLVSVNVEPTLFRCDDNRVPISTAAYDPISVVQLGFTATQNPPFEKGFNV